ncbi:radical SAM protein [Clostridiisalibacter paucivorans]|uniref:radical SAM protein n=1 Tax=Clostridiisalibacter paucivorans TaxID=408753 RepID=UPI000478D34F|nr:radical SAM protein [Clostridiisalibacter paucivorans]
MKSAKKLLSSMVIEEGLGYIEKNPMENLEKALNWADKLVELERHKNAVKVFKNICNDKNSNWYKLIERFFNDINPKVRKKFLTNFFLNSVISGIPMKERLQEEYGCNIPWAILMDPTSACNLKCTGCWASEYEKTDYLSKELLNNIVKQGKKLGIYMYIFSGGEPLTRKKDLLELARIHNDCMFMAFTNGTLVDEEFADELAEVGNFALAISVEGFEEKTDMRRGKGTFNNVVKAMELLKEKGVIFGFSTCYHKYNTDEIGSSRYIDFLIDKGCMFGWYFTYIPIGKDAVLDLLAQPEQREYMYHKVREFRSNKPIFVLDFWNDGEYVNGCIAGGKNYLHINANGDIEPCAFIHYSNCNIKDVSLLEGLQSPIFKAYKSNQPFNKNHLRPCPLLDNPKELRKIVNSVNAYSTQPIDKEDVNDLTNKCIEISKQWAETASSLWKEDDK